MSLENACANPAFPLPIGSIMPYMGLATQIPPTFLVCDGRTVSKVDYPELFKVLGGTFNGTASVAAGSFKLPKINDDATYLVPNGTLKTDPTKANGILTPVIHSSDALPAITAVNIPTLIGSDFSNTYPNKQVGITGRTFQVRGDHPDSYYSAGNPDNATPSVVKLSSSNESGGTAAMNTADYSFKNPTPAGLGNVVINQDHSVQYGGITCIYILKAFSSYAPSSSKNASINDGERRNDEYVAGVSAREAAEGTAIALADFQDDQSATAEAAAIAADGAGGGTEYLWENVPQLEGFRQPPFNTY
tara:strand:+ start:1588 stop:2499 length:912 start_codon:yes stop_codon:yes gene_type:complete